MEKDIVSIPGRNGGTLTPQQPGMPGKPGAGRKPNPFRQHIQELADGETEFVVKGRLLGKDGSPTGEIVEVAVSFPGALAIVGKAYKLAAKGDPNARKWLTETGWGKSLVIGEDPDAPVDGGFVLVLPSNGR